MRNDIVVGGRIEEGLIDNTSEESGNHHNNPWKFKSRHFNLYTEEEGEWW